MRKVFEPVPRHGTPKIKKASNYFGAFLFHNNQQYNLQFFTEPRFRKKLTVGFKYNYKRRISCKKLNSTLSLNRIELKIAYQIILANSYLKLLYSSSVTLSNHSTIPFWVLVLTAICVNSLSCEAPCQCTIPGGILTTSPLRSSCIGLPFSW